MVTLVMKGLNAKLEALNTSNSPPTKPLSKFDESVQPIFTE